MRLTNLWSDFLIMMKMQEKIRKFSFLFKREISKHIIDNFKLTLKSFWTFPNCNNIFLLPIRFFFLHQTKICFVSHWPVQIFSFTFKEETRFAYAGRYSKLVIKRKIEL